MVTAISEPAYDLKRMRNRSPYGPHVLLKMMMFQVLPQQHKYILDVTCAVMARANYRMTKLNNFNTPASNAFA